MAKITKRTISELMGGAPGTVLRDDQVVGFQARLNAGGTVTFSFEYRAGSGRLAPVRRFKLGRFGALTPDQAREAAKAAAASVAGGGDPAAAKTRDKGTPTFRDFTVGWLDGMEEIADRHPEQATLRKGSIRNYRSLLKVHVAPEFGSRRLDSIDREAVARLHKRLGKTMPATANRCLEFIGSAYRAANNAGHVVEGTNPARGIAAFKERRRERFLSSEELARLGAAIHKAETVGIAYVRPEGTKHAPRNLPAQSIDPYAAAAFRLLIFTGARLREILNAKWTDFDRERGQLRSFSKTGVRHIVLPAPALEVINSLDHGGEFIIASTDPKKPKADLARPWKAVQKLSGLEDVRIHDLRHSFASVAVSGGASLPMIGRLLGHTQPQTTARYSHLSDDPLRTAADMTAGRIAAAMSTKPSADILPVKLGKPA